MVPTVVVLGVGAVRLAVPPVGSVYHCNVFPVKAVAVKAEAVSFWQYATSLTAGATGNAFTVTVIAERGPSQLVVSSFWLT